MKKIALLGAGFIAGVHMEGWKRVEGAEVCAFFETNLEKASAFQDKYQIPHYNSFSRLLEEEKVDIVDICLPTFCIENIQRWLLLTRSMFFVRSP